MCLVPPVGLTMAIELARYGLQVRIIDKAPQRTDKSKALVIWSRPLELFERAGCSAALVDAGYKISSLNISAGKKPIAHLTLDGLASKYPFALMIPQSETERVLDEFLNTLGVKVERSVELANFTESAGKVVSTLRHSDGSEETFESQWLIGCDGAHSTVRHSLGMEFRGETSLIDWILADVHLENTPRTPEIHIVWHSDGVVAIFPIADLAIPDLQTQVATVVNAHLENKCQPECRTRQMDALLIQIQQIGHPVIVAGDLNTTGADGTPTSIRREIVKRVKNYEFWVTQSLKWGTPASLPFAAVTPIRYFKNYLDPTSIHLPVIGNNKEAILFPARGEVSIC